MARCRQPVGAAQPTREWLAIDGAVAPTMGERFWLEWPYLSAETLHILVQAFAHAFPDCLKILLWKNSGAHPAQRVWWPENVRYVWLLL